MKLKTKQSSASSQPAPQTVWSDASTVSHLRVPGKPLSQQSRKELDALATLKDEEIDYSDVPATNEEDWKDGVRGWLPLEERTMTLGLDADVYDWLQREGKSQAHRINLILKREVQRQQLADVRKTSPTSTMSKAS